MLAYKSLKDFWSNTQLTLSVKHFNKCIIIASISVFCITPNIYVQAVRTSNTASEIASERDITAVVKPSFISQISDALLRDSMVLAIQKGLETQVGSSTSLFLWSEGDNGLLLHHDKIYIPKALYVKVIAQHHGCRGSGWKILDIGAVAKIRLI